MEINIKKLEKGPLLVEGHTKKLYSTSHADYAMMEFKNDLVPLDGKKIVKARGKAQLNAEVASYIFQFLDSYHIPTHYIGKLDDKVLVVRRLDMIPVNVVIRNISSGAFAKSFRIPDGDVLPAPIIEFYYKNEKLGSPMVNEYHLYAFAQSNQEEVRLIQRLSAKINAIMKNFFERRNFNLADLKIEFGRSQGRLFVADDITLDSCRLWDIDSGVRLEKKLAQSSDGEVSRLYAEFAKRITHPRTRDEKLKGTN